MKPESFARGKRCREDRGKMERGKSSTGDTVKEDSEKNYMFHSQRISNRPEQVISL
jgi:hypothetical protein